MLTSNFIFLYRNGNADSASLDLSSFNFLLVRTAMTEIETSAHGSGGNHKEKDHRGGDTRVASHLPPVHGLFQAATARLETKSLLVQTIGLVDKELNFLTAFQNLTTVKRKQEKKLAVKINKREYTWYIGRLLLVSGTYLFDILYHDSFHVFDLTLDSPNVVYGMIGLRAVVKIEAILNNSAEFVVISKRNGLKRSIMAVLRQEAVLNVRKKSIWNSVLIHFIGHAQIADSVLDNVVKDIVVVHNSHLTILRWNFFQKDSRYRRKVSCC